MGLKIIADDYHLKALNPIRGDFNRPGELCYLRENPCYNPPAYVCKLMLGLLDDVAVLFPTCPASATPGSKLKLPATWVQAL